MDHEFKLRLFSLAFWLVVIVLIVVLARAVF
jgi:hypothetical protein